MSKHPGKKEIREWFEKYLQTAGTLANINSLTPRSLYMLWGANNGWYWDVDDIGLAQNPHDGSLDAMSGLYQYLQTLIDEKRK